ncbi:hypothetical protein ACSSZE_07420 [Acidithiobacillus caldus]
MNRSLKTAAKITAFAGAFALAGCSAIPMTVNAHYQPSSSVNRVPGAETVSVKVIVRNEKKHKNEISVQKSPFGIPMAGLYMPVTRDFRAAITKALVGRGFTVSDNGQKTLYIIIKKFFLVTNPGMFSTNHTGKLKAIARVFSASKEIYHCEIQIGNYKYVDGFFQSGYQSSANGLLNEGVNKLMDKTKFIKAMNG